MFYDAFAALVGQSGDALEARQVAPSDDPRFAREGRQIATFLRRTAAVWPQLFETLGAETEALERGLARASDALAAHALESARPGGEVSSPLERYRAVNFALDAAIERLTTVADAPWAVAALRDVRASLAEAAEIQGRLVDRMLEVR